MSEDNFLKERLLLAKLNKKKIGDDLDRLDRRYEELTTKWLLEEKKIRSLASKIAWSNKKSKQ